MLAVKSPIRVTVNGSDIDTSAPDLAALIADMDCAGQRVATAVNGEFVRQDARAGVRLAPGDRIEILSARQGG